MEMDTADYIDEFDDDIYSSGGTEDQLENGEISVEEAGFMLGYNDNLR